MKEIPWSKETCSEGFPIPRLTIPEGLTFPTALATNQIDATLAGFNVVVLSQSCDLGPGKIEAVLVCPYFSFEEMEKAQSDFKNKRVREKAKEGNYPSYYVLPPCSIPSFESEPLVVNFRQVATVPFNMVKDFAAEGGAQIRLLPPYREHMAQAFGRFVMRVGFPNDFSVS